MTYSVRTFAELAGVTVKTLHYYERRGLLAPTRTRAGYRRYTIKDLARLECIIALKSLGLPLKQITPMLRDGTARLKGSRSTITASTGSRSGSTRARSARGAADRKEHEPSRRASRKASALLGAHRDKLVEKQRLIAESIAAIDAITRAGDPHEPGRGEARRAEAALQKFVGESTWARYEVRRARLADPAPRAPDRASPSRFALFHEIREALDRDPTGASAEPLAARWHALVEAEAEGNPKTIAAQRKIAATRATWPDGARRYVASLYDTDVDTWERVMTFVTRPG